MSQTLANPLTLNIHSEIEPLRTVLLHRPGQEVENLIPHYLESLLFDDIPYLNKMQEEHDAFAQALANHSVQVLYVKDLLLAAATSQEAAQQLVTSFLCASHSTPRIREKLADYLLTMPRERMVDRIISGVAKKDLPHLHKETLSDYVNVQEPFYLNPLSNLYFMRDPVTVIGRGVSVNRMSHPARSREPLLLDFIFRHHPLFREQALPRWYEPDHPFPLEGGDQLVLSPDVVAIGVSERTSAEAIEVLSRNLLNHSSFSLVMAVEIPKRRAFMHLDTVFTMVSHDQFTIHPAIQDSNGEMPIFLLSQSRTGSMTLQLRSSLLQTLKEVLHLPTMDLIPCGGGDRIVAAREQWNDASNTLAIAPGVVVTYDRNEVTNQTLREHGVTVLEVPSSELSRGRGGPRCMSMPLLRGAQP